MINTYLEHGLAHMTLSHHSSSLAISAEVDEDHPRQRVEDDDLNVKVKAGTVF